MNNETSYTPPKVWQWEAQTDGAFAEINRPVAGPTHDKVLDVGSQPMQLYSQGTANGLKVTVMLEELLARGESGAGYDKHVVNIFEGDQFGSGFVELNPNSKIPVLVDQSSETPIRIFESGAILLYLANKFECLVPTDPQLHSDCMAWLFWQVGTAPFLGGGFGHFYKYAPVTLEYPINRYAMEAKRQLDVLNRHLAENEYMCGNQYSIADIAIWPWFYLLVFQNGYEAAEFLQVESYEHVGRWASQIWERDAAQRGFSHRG